jgi:hypothetical protein
MILATLDAVLDLKNLQLLLAIPSSLGGIMALYQLAAMRRRNKLKFDLEMLKYYKEIDASSPHYLIMKQKIEREIQKCYPAPGDIRTDLDRSDIFWGCLSILAGGIIFSITKENKLLYGLAIGCFLAGFYGVYLGFERKILNKKRKRALQALKSPSTVLGAKHQLN